MNSNIESSINDFYSRVEKDFESYINNYQLQNNKKNHYNINDYFSYIDDIFHDDFIDNFDNILNDINNMKI
jgi:hypothetical protein